MIIPKPCKAIANYPSDLGVNKVTWINRLGWPIGSHQN